ncbi:hypothetical protein HKD37_08G022402 [Glycine soja]
MVAKLMYGRVLKDHFGTIVFAFSSKIGTCSINIVELWAIAIRIKIASLRVFESFMVESYSQFATNLIQVG